MTERRRKWGALCTDPRCLVCFYDAPVGPSWLWGRR